MKEAWKIAPRRTGGLLAIFAWLSLALLSSSHAQSDINLTGYTLTFHDEFDALSVTTSNPKGTATWYFSPPYGAAGAYSDSIWDTGAFSVNNGILSDQAWIVTGEDRAGAYCGGPVGMKDGNGTALVMVGTAGTAINTHSGFQWDGYVGMKFTTGAGGLTVSQLGRYVTSGNSQTHDLILLDSATGNNVTNGRTTVATSGATPGTFVYANLPSSVTLPANHSYYLLSHEGNGDTSDAWHAGVSTIITTASTITVEASEWGEWHSGNLSSVDPDHNGFAQQYGYFETRCQMPDSGNGAWPAFWLVPKNFGQGARQIPRASLLSMPPKHPCRTNRNRGRAITFTAARSIRFT